MKKVLSLIFIGIIAISLSACGNKNSIDDNVIVVGASVSPHAEILEQTRSYIESKGYKLKIVEFTEYKLPNIGVEDESLDANFFQHTPFLNQYNEDNNASLVAIHSVHFEPLAVYKGKSSSLDLNRGSVVGVPNDTTNEARALLLLDSLGLIVVDTTKGLKATKLDILENPLNLDIIELESAIIPSKLQDLDIAVINGNVALTSKITDKVIPNSSEDTSSISAKTYANVIAVKDKYKDKEAIKILIEAFKQENVIEYINNTYNGLVIPFSDN